MTSLQREFQTNEQVSHNKHKPLEAENMVPWYDNSKQLMKHEISELQWMIKILKDENDELVNDLLNTVDEYEEITYRLKDVEEQCFKCKEQCHDLKTEKDKLEDILEKEKERVLHQDKFLEVLNHMRETTKQKERNWSNERYELEEQCRKLTQDNMVLDAEVKLLLIDKSHGEKKVQNMNKAVSNLQSTVNKLNKEKDELLKMLDKARNVNQQEEFAPTENREISDAASPGTWVLSMLASGKDKAYSTDKESGSTWELQKKMHRRGQSIPWHFTTDPSDVKTLRKEKRLESFTSRVYTAPTNDDSHHPLEKIVSSGQKLQGGKPHCAELERFDTKRTKKIVVASHGTQTPEMLPILHEKNSSSHEQERGNKRGLRKKIHRRCQSVPWEFNNDPSDATALAKGSKSEFHTSGNCTSAPDNENHYQMEEKVSSGDRLVDSPPYGAETGCFDMACTKNKVVASRGSWIHGMLSSLQEEEFVSTKQDGGRKRGIEKKTHKRSQSFPWQFTTDASDSITPGKGKRSERRTSRVCTAHPVSDTNNPLNEKVPAGQRFGSSQLHCAETECSDIKVTNKTDVASRGTWMPHLPVDVSSSTAEKEWGSKLGSQKKTHVRCKRVPCQFTSDPRESTAGLYTNLLQELVASPGKGIVDSCLQAETRFFVAA